ncbi:MAG: hypothetical protein HYZ16_02700, partial [Bacteroidetes bacterium]|nr:hypothetical protein [Bacteroidota bacterium]
EIQKVQYKGDKLYNADGTEYAGGNEFAGKVLKDLNQLKADDDVLKELTETLETSKNIHTIQMTDGPDDGNSNSPESQYNDEHGIPTGSTTKYNPDKGENVRGDKRTPRAGLAHELLGHGWDSDQGKADYSKTDNGIRMYEVDAVNIENRARAAAGDPKKTTYGGKPIPKELLDNTQKKKNNMKLLLFAILFSCTQKDTMFLDKVLNDFDRYSYFVAVELESTDYKGRVIIENDDLYYYFEQSQSLNRSAYKDMMFNKLRSDEPLDIESADLERWNFYKIPSIPSVVQTAEKGVEEFIKTYFDGRVLKDGITDDERTVIIAKLYEWEIPSKIDDETGYLVISR